MYVLVCIMYVFVCIDLVYIWCLARSFWHVCTCQWKLIVPAFMAAPAWFIFRTLLSQFGMVWWPDHSPRVDVKELASRSCFRGSVACAFREVRLLTARHRKRNGSGSGRPWHHFSKGQYALNGKINIKSPWNNVLVCIEYVLSMYWYVFVCQYKLI